MRGLSKLVKTVRGKSGSVRRTYWVRGKTLAMQATQQHAGKVAAGAAVAAAAYAAHRSGKASWGTVDAFAKSVGRHVADRLAEHARALPHAIGRGLGATAKFAWGRLKNRAPDANTAGKWVGRKAVEGFTAAPSFVGRNAWKAAKVSYNFGRGVYQGVRASTGR